jgi:tape measure domain-containing protein
MADATADIKILVKDVAGVTRSIDRIEKKLAQMGRASAAASRQMVAANKRAQSSFDQLSLGIRNITRVAAVGAAAIYGLGVAIREVSKIQALQLQLKSVSDGSQDFAKNLELVKAVALETGTSFTETGTQLVRYTRALQRFGGGAEEAAIVLDTLNKAFLLTGTTGSEATSVLVQMSQALTAGALSGDEFRSFAENAGVLVDELAKTMDVSVDKLKKLGAQGKITADKVIETAIRVNKEFTALFKESGELPLDRAIQNVITQFEFFFAKSETFKQISGALGKFVIALADQFFILTQAIFGLNFDTVKDDTVKATGIFAKLGDTIILLTSAFVTFFRLVAAGLSTVVTIISSFASYTAEVFRGLGRTAVNTGEMIKKAWDAIGTDDAAAKIKKAGAEYVAAQENNLDATNANLAKIGNNFEAKIDELNVEIWNALRDGMEDPANRKGGIASGILEQLLKDLKDLKTPKVEDELNKAAADLAKDFNKALEDAFRNANDSRKQLEFVTSGGDGRTLEQYKAELDLLKQVDEWRAKGVSPDKLAALEAILQAQLRYTEALDHELEVLKAKDQLNADLTDTTEKLLRKQFETANFTNTKTQEELDYQMELYDIEQKRRELAITVGPEEAAIWAERQKQLLDATVSLDKFKLTTQEVDAAWNNVALTIANSLGAIIDGSKSAQEALKDLLKQLLIVLAQAAILKALGMPGSYGSILGGLVGGGTLSAGGGSGAGPTVRVFNYGTAPGGVQTRTRPDGSVDIVLGQLAASLATGGNVLDTTLRRTYGIRRQGV